MEPSPAESRIRREEKAICGLDVYPPLRFDAYIA
jgi:hypothetical protein